MVPVTVVCSKYDLFAKQNEPKNKKIICNALRYMCVANGADLVFASVNEQNPLRLFKNLVGWHTFKSFESPEKTGPSDGENPSAERQPQSSEASFFKIPAPDTRHEHCLLIFAGTDNMLKIDEP